MTQPTFSPTSFYYNQQIKTYLLHFMSIFSGLQVQVGKSSDKEERLITVPIHYAPTDRVVASIISNNTQNSVLRLPQMGVWMRDLRMDAAGAHGVGLERRQTYTPVGGMVPEDTTTVYQRMPYPYIMTVDLGIYVSNTDQHFQVLEQVLPLFEPQLVLETSDGFFDWAQSFTVTLVNISLDTNFPISTDRRIIQSTLSFEVNINLDIPAIVRKNFIEQIYVRMGTVSNDSNTSLEMISDLDAQGIQYELSQDATNLDI